jgi:1,4-dihydroxy-6-naphthoate synthase
MPPSAPCKIRLAHSPDSDDAFMFYGLATQKLRSPRVSFEHVLQDIESLNQAALEGRYDMTAISYHAYPYVAGQYVLTSAGSSVGDGFGPLLVARRPLSRSELTGKTIAVPGARTTAYLALRLWLPDFQPLFRPFDQILQAVQDGAADAGLLIHEGQLTFNRSGVHLVLDLGRWWKQTQGLPLPLGANAIKRSLDPEVRAECCAMLSKSIAYALANREEALAYARQFARGLDSGLTDKFVGMYVNHHTVAAGPDVRLAAQRLLDLGADAGLISQRVTLEFV